MRIIADPVKEAQSEKIAIVVEAAPRRRDRPGEKTTGPRSDWCLRRSYLTVVVKPRSMTETVTVTSGIVRSRVISNAGINQAQTTKSRMKRHISDFER